jgi:hypothetical protein
VGATRRDWAAFAIGLGASAVLGAIAGLIWGVVAPRALFQEVAPGAAQLVNAETSAFIVADIWFCGITAAGGLITGIAGTRLLVRGGNWPAAAGLVLGAVAAAFVALLVGQNIGLGTYNHQLATAAPGTFFNSSLGLSAKSALAAWPLLASAIIALTEGARRAQPGQGLPLAEEAGPRLD